MISGCRGLYLLVNESAGLVRAVSGGDHKFRKVEENRQAGPSMLRVSSAEIPRIRQRSADNHPGGFRQRESSIFERRSCRQRVPPGTTSVALNRAVFRPAYIPLHGERCVSIASQTAGIKWNTTSWSRNFTSSATALNQDSHLPGNMLECRSRNVTVDGRRRPVEIKTVLLGRGDSQSDIDC